MNKFQLLGCFVLSVVLTLPAVAGNCDSYDCDSSSRNGRGGMPSRCKQRLENCMGRLAARKAPYLHHASQRAMQYNWHANYAHSAYGQPIALVVPPTAQLQTNWSWGAPSSRISRIDHQFGREYPGSGPFGGSFRNTPVWPADTAQFGVYHVRGPWYPMQR